MGDFFSELMKSVDSLTEAQVAQLLSALEVKKSGSIKTTDYKPLVEIPKACPGCGSIDIIKKGKNSADKQIYKCKDCSKKFSDTTGTAMFRSKLTMAQWKGLLLGIVQNLTLKQIAEMIDCSEQSVLANKHKLCVLLKENFGTQDNLSTIIECDEKYVNLSFKGKRDPRFFIYTLGRLPRHNRTYQEKVKYLMKHGFWQELQSDHERLEQLMSSNRTYKRGISNEQVCVLTCKDRNGHIFIKTVCLGRPESEDIARVLSDKIPYDAILITDSHSSYISFVESKKIHHEAIPSGKHAKGTFNLANVNAMHSQIESMYFINTSRRPATKYLDLYLMLFYWLEKNKQLHTNQKVDSLLGVVQDSNGLDGVTLEDISDREIDFNTKGLIPKKV